MENRLSEDKENRFPKDIKIDQCSVNAKNTTHHRTDIVMIAIFSYFRIRTPRKFRPRKNATQDRA